MAGHWRADAEEALCTLEPAQGGQDSLFLKERFQSLKCQDFPSLPFWKNRPDSQSCESQMPM